MKVTAYFQEVVRRKRPNIKTAWIARVLETPLEERQQSDGRYALWGQVPEAQNRVLRVWPWRTVTALVPRRSTTT